MSLAMEGIEKMAEKTDDGLRDKFDRLVKLVEAFRVHQAKGYELIEEMQALIAEEATTGQLAKRALATFGKFWSERYSAKFVPSFARDMASLKRILKTVKLEDLERRMAAYLKDNERFVCSTTHSLPLFVANVNNYGARQAHGPDELLLDDVSRTRKQQERLRESAF